MANAFLFDVQDALVQLIVLVVISCIVLGTGVTFALVEIRRRKLHGKKSAPIKLKKVNFSLKLLDNNLEDRKYTLKESDEIQDEISDEITDSKEEIAEYNCLDSEEPNEGKTEDPLKDTGGLLVKNGLFVQFDFGFRARLVQADEETRRYYGAVMNELRGYEGIKLIESWKQLRARKGRKSLAMLFFRGKRLCVALALNPKDYVASQHFYEDCSAVRRFKNLGVMIRFTSLKKIEFFTDLFAEIARQNSLRKTEVAVCKTDWPNKNRDELIENDLVKIKTNATSFDELRSAGFEVAAMVTGKVKFGIKANAFLSNMRPKNS